MLGLIYLRVSTDDQESGLEMQRAITTKVCNKLKINVVATYEDFAISGASRDRQGLESLKAKILKLADKEEEIAIIVYDISRIARDMIIGEEIIQISNVVEAKLLSLIKSTHPHVQHVQEVEWNRVFEILNLNNILCS